MRFMLSVRGFESPSKIKAGCSPICFMCCSRVACRISLKANKMAQCSLRPQQPLAVDTFKICKSISRVAFMDGNGGVLFGLVERHGCESKRSHPL